MKYNLLFYAEQAKLLNNYKKITKEMIDDMMKKYQVNSIPSDFIIEKRTNNYFVHNIEKIQTDYTKQLPYLLNGQLYKTSIKTKNELKSLGKQTTMYEKDLCKEIWFASFYKETNYPIDIIDIQIPLKRIRENKYGEIDLVGVSINNNIVTIHLIEAKPLSTNETLLRATIESITYGYIIKANEKKFKCDFKKYIELYDGKGKQVRALKEKIKNNEINIDDVEIRSMVLVPKKLYEPCFSKYIYDNYIKEIDYYYVEYSSDDIEYFEKDKRKPTLFKDGRYPKIEKF